MVAKIFRRAAGSLAVLFLLLFAVSSAYGQQKVSGRVSDQTGKGIGDVLVSDGYNVVKSDIKGNFLLETNQRARFLFMSTPGGYEQVGSFYYRLEKNQAEQLDFRLKKVSQQSNKFIHIGDTEATIYKNWIDGLKGFIFNHKLAFLLLNGDICYEKGMNFHAREITTETMGLRVVYSLGNHDLVAGDCGEQMYEKLFGPAWYSFNVAGVHFVNLPVNYGDKVPSYSADDLYSWLRKDLDAIPRNTPVIVITHHLYGYADNFVMKSDKQTHNLYDYNFKGYLYAHYHTNSFHKTANGASLYSTMSPNKGGIDHSPSSFRVLTINEKGELSSEIRYSNLEKHIVANGFRSVNNRGYSFVANIYDTGTEVVSAEVVDGPRAFLMVKKSSWSWSLNIVEEFAGRSLRIKVKFSDGSVVYKQIAMDHTPEIKWVSNLGSNIFMTSPVIAGNLVIAATTDDDSGKNAAVKAFDRVSGLNKWSFKTKNSVKNNMVFSDGTLLVCDIEGWLYAIDVATGSLKWSRALRENGIHPVFTQGITAYNGIVYAGQGKNLTAVNISDGKILWVNGSWNGGVSAVASLAVDPDSSVLLAAG